MRYVVSLLLLELLSLQKRVKFAQRCEVPYVLHIPFASVSSNSPSEKSIVAVN